MKLKLTLLTLYISLPIAVFSQQWMGMLGDSLYQDLFYRSPLVNGIKKTSDDSLYINGGFKYAGSLIVNSVAKFNGITWENLGNGCSPYGRIEAIEKYNNMLFVGGSLDQMPEQPTNANLAVWYDGAWHRPPGVPSGGTVTSDVFAFKIFQNKLFMCGNFEHIGNVNTPHFDRIAAFDGTQWINVGSFSNWARNLEVFNNELYAGGYWGVKKYLGGTTWQDFSIQPNNVVFDLEADTFNSFLYVGGQFNRVNGQISTGVAMWDGFKWNPMGYYCETVWPNSMKVYQGDLYTGSGFLYDSIADQYKFWIARWDGEQWDSVGGLFNNWALSMEIYNGEILMGGADYDLENNRYTGGIIRLKMPDNGCEYIKPRINTFIDTVYLVNNQAQIQLYNNNPYVDTWLWDFGDGQTANIKDPLHVYTDTGTYPVSVTVSHNGCTKTASKNIVVELGTSINEIENFNYAFKVFPNPTSGSVTVACTLPQGQNGEICLYNSYGSKVYTAPVSSGTNAIQINPETLPSGATLCALYINGKQILLEKIIKKS